MVTNQIHKVKMHILQNILTDLDREITFNDILKESNFDYETARYVEMELLESRFIKVRWTDNEVYISRLKFFNFKRDGLI